MLKGKPNRDEPVWKQSLRPVREINHFGGAGFGSKLGTWNSLPSREKGTLRRRPKGSLDCLAGCVPTRDTEYYPDLLRNICFPFKAAPKRVIFSKQMPIWIPHQVTWNVTFGVPVWTIFLLKAVRFHEIGGRVPLFEGPPFQGFIFNLAPRFASILRLGGEIVDNRTSGGKLEPF